MTTLRRCLPAALILVTLVALVPAAAATRDRGFGSVVKHIKKNYNGKTQGTFGAITFARFLVKIIRPAGVKSFKVTMFKSVDFSQIEGSELVAFNSFVPSAVGPDWQPLVQYSSQLKRQWVYVYSQPEGEDMKMLVVALQQKQAFVLQLKFSPEKLIAFIDDPKIMGISLKDKTGPAVTPPDPPMTETVVVDLPPPPLD
jgi:hypothetical protein